MNIPETGFLRLPQVLILFPVSRSTWWAGVRDGRYPKQVHLSKRCTAWRVSDISKLVDEKSATCPVACRCHEEVK
jgi:prophage regulatory protein